MAQGLKPEFVGGLDVRTYPRDKGKRNDKAWVDIRDPTHRKRRDEWGTQAFGRATAVGRKMSNALVA